jgi:hypothetical protein
MPRTGSTGRARCEATLATWVGDQRTHYQRTIQGELYYGEPPMPKERICLLNKLNFVWYSSEVKWRRTYHSLEEHVKKNGPDAPIEEWVLREWLVRQRREYRKWKKGKKSTMTEERASFLNKEGYFSDD